MPDQHWMDGWRRVTEESKRELDEPGSGVLPQGRRPLHLADVGKIIRGTFAAWFKDNAPSMGAAIAFYTLFAIAPILLIVIWMAGAFIGPDIVQAHILAQLRNLLGDPGTNAIRALLVSAKYSARSGYSTAAGIITVVIGSTSVFAELQNALNRIWHAPPRGVAQGLWRLIRARLLSFGMVFGVGFLLLVSLTASAGFEGLGSWLGTSITDWHGVVNVLDMALAFAITTVVFAVIYKFVPSERLAWGDVWIGGLVTATLFMAGKLVIVVYLGKLAFNSAYGIAGSFLVLLLWVYFSAQIFLLGAEFTCVYAQQRGSRIAGA
jgi:membrane protein